MVIVVAVIITMMVVVVAASSEALAAFFFFRAGRLFLNLRHALRRMAVLVLLLVFWALAGACQRHGVGVGGFRRHSSSSSSGRLFRGRRVSGARGI